VSGRGLEKQAPPESGSASEKAAVLSDCGHYRYALWRDTNILGNEGQVRFVMLNPSTADATEDDPTIRRCVRFAADWGFARLVVANVYALRSTDPAGLADAADPVGPENDHWLRETYSDQTIAAWGASKYLSREREAEVLTLLTYGGSLGLDCLGQTKDLRPRHPLYVPAATRPQRFAQRAAA
jgi:hypothetical protein